MAKNDCIRCTIHNCTHNATNHTHGHHAHEDYCTLNQISVGTHESNPTEVECTDCQSFVLK